MTLYAENNNIDWARIKLVVFDVDGTLYDQRGLRLCMLREMLLYALRHREIEFIRILRAYRHIRERLGDSLHEDFEQELVSRVASVVGCGKERVRSTAEEWLEQRPLRHLIRFRYAGLQELFQSLRKQGKKVGIFSDYPAQRKIDAMKLEADVVVCATDKDIAVLKPHSKGLVTLMERAGAASSETLMIGDRPERDGLAARATNVQVLIRSGRKVDGWTTFSRYDEPMFCDIVLNAHA